MIIFPECTQTSFHSWRTYRLHWSWEQIRVANRRQICHFYGAFYFMYTDPCPAWKSDASRPRQQFFTYQDTGNRWKNSSVVAPTLFSIACSVLMFLFTVHSRPVVEVGLVLSLNVIQEKKIIIFCLADIIKKTFLHSMTPSNIKSGSISTGISSFDLDLFTDADFAAAFFTDRAGPNVSPNYVQDTNTTQNNRPLPGSSNMTRD
jgi:hypothetical protein